MGARKEAQEPVKTGSQGEQFFELLDMQAYKNHFQNAESFLIVLSSLK